MEVAAYNYPLLVLVRSFLDRSENEGGGLPCNSADYRHNLSFINKFVV
jgi:hypothetical protein